MFVVADAFNNVFESDNGNNGSTPQPIAITQILSDLQVTSINQPVVGVDGTRGSFQAGTPMTIGWSVKNYGGEITNVNSWRDRIYLSIYLSIT